MPYLSIYCLEYRILSYLKKTLYISNNDYIN